MTLNDILAWIDATASTMPKRITVNEIRVLMGSPNHPVSENIVYNHVEQGMFPAPPRNPFLKRRHRLILEKDDVVRIIKQAWIDQSKDPDLPLAI